MLSVTLNSNVGQYNSVLPKKNSGSDMFGDNDDDNEDDDEFGESLNGEDDVAEFATTVENYTEQGFLWMCALCKEQPTFETIYDLFRHKKQHGEPKASDACNVGSPQVKAELHSPSPSPPYPNTSPNSPEFVDASTNFEKSPHSVYVPLLTLPPASPTSSEDIPLSNLTSKLNSLKNKGKSKIKKAVTKKLKTKTVQNTDKIKLRSRSKRRSNDVDENTPKVVEELTPALKDVSDDGNEEYCDDNILNDTASSDDDDDDNDDIGEDDNGDEDFMKSLKARKARGNDGEKKSKMNHTCKICNLECRTRVMLSEHKKTHLFENTGCYKCEKCGKMCPKYDNFTRHLTIHLENREKTHQCGRCSASFYNLADLKRHKVLHMTVKPFTCEHCGEGFTRQDNLLIHAYKHTGVQYKKFACKECDKVLNSPSALVMHVKTHTVKNVFCPEPGCKFSCYLQSQLRQHVRKHSGEKPFQCSKCGRCFARSNDMKNHVMNVHERIRPFKCPSCPKEFALIGNLRIHYTTHTNERPYLCAQCGKCFNHPSTLRKHSVIMHNPWRVPKSSRTRIVPGGLSGYIGSPVSQRGSAEGKRGRGRARETFEPKAKAAKTKVADTAAIVTYGVKTEDNKEGIAEYVVQQIEIAPHLPHVTVHVPVQAPGAPPFVVPTVLVQQPELPRSAF